MALGKSKYALYARGLTQKMLYSFPRGSNIIKLVQNYRSHSAILNFPNKVFYDGELEVCADPVITTIKRLDRARWLPRPGFPVVFHSVCGMYRLGNLRARVYLLHDRGESA